MKKRKFAAGVCAVAMAVTMLPSGVYAAPQEGSTNVSYGVGEEYTLNIPTTLALNSTKTMDLGITKSNIKAGDTLNIYIGTNIAELSNAAGNKVKSTMTATFDSENVDITGATTTAPVVIGHYAGVNTLAQTKTTLTFGDPVNADTTNDIEAGDYTGTVTFTADIVTP